MEFARRHGDFALGGAAVQLTFADDHACESAAIVLLGSGQVAARASGSEAVLVGSPIEAASIVRAAEQAVRDVDPPADVHGDSDYRRGLIGVMVRRGIEQAALEEE
jgi:carbon-monoxide dehydrogenase medium subunit/6-hydroxypseudooxynicotine dehydrogenase subunit alpha